MTANCLDPGWNRTSDLRFRNPPPPVEVVGTAFESPRDVPHLRGVAHKQPTRMAGHRGLATLSDLSPEYVKRLRVRLEAKLSPEPNTGCWLWTGAAHEDGYGHIGVAGRTANAHRVMWILTHGDVTPESVTDHLCRQPACCNPAHLENVSHAENIRRGRPFASVRVSCQRNHDLLAPRARTKTGQCRACINLAVGPRKKWRLKKRTAAGLLPRGASPTTEERRAAKRMHEYAWTRGFRTKTLHRLVEGGALWIVQLHRDGVVRCVTASGRLEVIVKTITELQALPLTLNERVQSRRERKNDRRRASRQVAA